MRLDPKHTLLLQKLGRLPRVSLVCVVKGAAYERYANDLFRSAVGKFLPTRPDLIQFVALDGPEGWPAATMYRWHVLLANFPRLRGDYVFLSDADMLFTDRVGDEILPIPTGFTAVQHPGYTEKPEPELPYERRPESVCATKFGTTYYAGGFAGGNRQSVKRVARIISQRIDADAAHHITPRWHDESCLNSVLAELPPAVTLSPSYCYPENPSWYRTFWPEDYTPRLTALDKPEHVRGDRHG